MAVISPVATEAGGYILWTWTAITESDTAGPAFIEHNLSDLIIQNGGTLGGSTLSVSGSLDNSDYTADIVDPGGTAVSITDATGSALRDGWLYIKPVYAGGTSQSANPMLLARKVR